MYEKDRMWQTEYFSPKVKDFSLIIFELNYSFLKTSNKMKKTILFCSFFFYCYVLFAQNEAASFYGNSITKEGLKKHLTVIASDEFEGRETGTEGQRKAAAYIEAEFKRIGLQKPSILKTYQQFYPLHQDSVQTSILSINKVPAEMGKDFLIPLTNNDGKFSSKKILFVGYGIDDNMYSDYTALNAKGCVVVFFLGEPKKDGKYFLGGENKVSKWTISGLENKLRAAEKRGAVGAFVINHNMETFTKRLLDNNTKNGITFRSIEEDESSNKQLNYALVSFSFIKKLLPQNFDSILTIARAKDFFKPTQTDEKTTIAYRFKKSKNIIYASNVIGVIEGTDKKDEYVFCTGHYDHLGKHDGKIYYGADDDGSGTCGVIEMATAFAKAAANGNRPRRTMVFMTVSGEEKGLWGSEYYSDHPLFSLDKTSVDLNTDMVGRVDTERKKADTLNYVYVVGHDKISSELPIINEGQNNKYTNLVLDYKFDDPNDTERIYYRSDHYNFARKGVPVLFFYDGMLKSDYHKPTDTVDKINFDLYEKRVRMIFYTAWEIANRNDMLKRDKKLVE